MMASVPTTMPPGATGRAAASPGGQPAAVSDSQPHLLVVDDDQRLRDLLRRYLAGEGFRVTLAADAEEAELRLHAMVFDLLVLDIMLPGIDGLELTRRLRHSDGVPILLLSAKGEPDDRIAGLTAGADDYLAKPFEPRELVLRINAILRQAAPRQAWPRGSISPSAASPSTWAARS